MVDILTDAGVFLDLDPDAEFEITIENPLLQDDRIPVPFSTAISFLPTPTNKAVFGYLDTMMLEPRVKQLGASILVGGVQLCAGSLVYDGIDEDGRIQYTFSGKDLQQEWSAKLWELPGLSWDTEGSGYDYASFLAALKADEISGVHLPPVVDASLAAEPAFRATPSGSRPGTGQVNYNQKYRNQPDTDSLREIVPAIELGRIIGGVLSLADMGDAADLLQHVVVFGTNWGVGWPSTKMATFSYNAAETLPDVTLGDLVMEVCRMLCGAVFQDGAGFRFIPAAEVLAAANPLDWDRKASDRFRSAREEKAGYELGFEAEVAGTGGQTSDVGAKEVASLSGVLEEAGDSYAAVTHKTLEDLYSLKKAPAVQIKNLQDASIGIAEEILIDRCDVAGAKQDAEGTEETHSVTVGLRLAKCTPVRRYWLHTTNVRTLRSDVMMAAVLTLPAYGAERPKDVYIALYGNGQACDKGVVLADPDSASSDDLTVGDSLAPQALFERYHQAYAAWLATDRQLLSVDVNLSPFELASFRMWQAVRVRSRNFLVSKLSVRVAASADGVDVSADLISL